MLNKYMCAVYFLLISYSSIAKDILSSCDYRESNVQSCLQKEIIKSSQLRQTLVLRPVNYALDNPLYLNSNTSINGNGAVLSLKFVKPYQSAFYGESLSSVQILNLKLDGGGVYYESSFINPYYQPGKPLAIGFSNTNNGIVIIGKSSNIIIDNVTMLNLHHGIYLDAISHSNYSSRIESVIISNSKFDNIGKAGIFLRNVSDAKIYKNNISNVNGNFVSGVAPDLRLTAWADGIYVRGLQDSKIESNIISSIRRIGIVLEGEVGSSGEPITLNNNIVISGNQINNLHGSKGTEYNAGIWVEPYNNSASTKYYKTSKVFILNNLINNQFAVHGSHAQWGLRLGANYNQVVANRIINFMSEKSVGLTYSYGINIIKANHFESNTQNIFHAGDNKKNSTLILDKE